MFDFVRNHNRLFQGLLVLLIFPSFVFFGVQGYTSMRDNEAKTVAEVDGQPLKQAELEAAHRRQVERLRTQMPNIDIKLLDTPQMRQGTLDELVRERVLMTAVVKDHLAVGDERLARLFQTDPEFAAVRRPDGSLNKDMLAAQGMTSEYFAQQLRQSYAMRQVLGVVQASAVVSPATGNLALAAVLEQRETQWQIYPTKDYLAKVNPTDADLSAYHSAHQAQFRSTEEADIEWVLLDAAALAKQVSVSDDDLRKYYEQNQARYTSAEERRASHILIAVAQDAPAAERDKAKAKAEAVLAEVRKNPAAFADIARKESQDPGSAEKGGDLDFFGRNAMTKPFEDAVFAMKAGEVSPLVSSEFGFHIIKLTGTRGGVVKPFEAVKAELAQEVAKQQAQGRWAEAAEQFSNTVYEQADSLQPVIDKLKLERHTATVRRQPAAGVTGALASAKLLEAVFGQDAVANKRNTEAIDIGNNQLVAARVVAHRPERVLPLAEVKAQVLEAVRQEQARALAQKEGQARLAALRGKSDEALQQKGLLSRTTAQAVPRGLLEAVLRADLTQGATAVGADLGAEGYAVARVLKVVPREAADPDLQRARPALGGALAAAEADAYYASLKRRFKTNVHPLKPAEAPADDKK